MGRARPVYVVILIAAVVIFVAGVSLALSDLFYRVGMLEHEGVHARGACLSHADHR